MLSEAPQWEIDDWERRCAELDQDNGPLSLVAPIIAAAHAGLVERGKYEAARLLREDWLHALQHVTELQAAAAYLGELHESKS